MDTPQRGVGGRFLKADANATADNKPDAAPVTPTGAAQPAQGTSEKSDGQIPHEPVNGAAEVDPAPWGRKADGTPRAKPGRRAGWIENPEAPGLRVGASVLASKDVDQKYKQTADMLVSVSTTSLQSALGDDWIPESGEKKMLENATYEYLKANRFPDLPPGWVLLGVVAMYALPRVLKPAFQEKIAAIINKF